MKKRNASILIGLLTLCCLGSILSVIYPFSVTQSHALLPPDDRFTINQTSGYRVNGSIVVDGEEALVFEGVVTEDGERYQFLKEHGIRTSEAYQSTPDGTVYGRTTFERSTRIDQIRRQIVRDDDRELLVEESAGARVTFVTEEENTDLADGIRGTAMVFVRSLDVTAYEKNATDDDSIDFYEPRGGWYGVEERYRVTDASGAVRTHSGTMAVESADVSWEVTTPAGSYAEYVLVTLTSSDPTNYEISLEIERDDTSTHRPAWINETRTR